MNIYEMTKKYYPLMWNSERIDALVRAGKLTTKEAEEIKNNK